MREASTSLDSELDTAAVNRVPDSLLHALIFPNRVIRAIRAKNAFKAFNEEAKKAMKHQDLTAKIIECAYNEICLRIFHKTPPRGSVSPTHKHRTKPIVGWVEPFNDFNDFNDFNALNAFNVFNALNDLNGL